AFALASPDALIAARNVERFGDTSRVDVSYLAVLSADAAPALLALPEPQRDCALQRVLPRLAATESWPGWNVSRARARRVLGAPLDAAGGGDVAHC
ncbi:MAG TPA: DUF4153 domain-containing protein, partial [Egibacteraceae bacterium]|nr:DUF4153 domain-containing protein [Egibacteraceae bacterium]